VGAVNTSVIVAGARTPVGRLMGSLSGLSGSELGGIAIKAALAKAGVSGDQVQYVIMGRGRQVGATTVVLVHAVLTSPPGHEVQNVHSFPPRARLNLVRDRCRPARGMLACWPKPIQAALHRPGE